MNLVSGRTYTRKQIRDIVGGGDLQSYLPNKGGSVLCGCFDPLINARAPFEIDVGRVTPPTPKVLRAARLLETQKNDIPVFIKRKSNAWEYIGKYRAIRYSEDSTLIRDRPNFRSDAAGILFLVASPPDDSEQSLLDIDLNPLTGYEGGKSLALHLRRERRPELAAAKKRFVLLQQGYLGCEACGYRFDQIRTIGDACCEAHHIRPLSDRERSEPTSMDDLAILCSNCHRMIHRTSPLASIKTFRQMIKAVV